MDSDMGDAGGDSSTLRYFQAWLDVLTSKLAAIRALHGVVATDVECRRDRYVVSDDKDGMVSTTADDMLDIATTAINSADAALEVCASKVRAMAAADAQTTQAGATARQLVFDQQQHADLRASFALCDSLVDAAKQKLSMQQLRLAALAKRAQATESRRSTHAALAKESMLRRLKARYSPHSGNGSPTAGPRGLHSPRRRRIPKRLASPPKTITGPASPPPVPSAVSTPAVSVSPPPQPPSTPDRGTAPRTVAPAASPYDDATSPASLTPDGGAAKAQTVIALSPGTRLRGSSTSRTVTSDAELRTPRTGEQMDEVGSSRDDGDNRSLGGASGGASNTPPPPPVSITDHAALSLHDMVTVTRRSTGGHDTADCSPATPAMRVLERRRLRLLSPAATMDGRVDSSRSVTADATPPAPEHGKHGKHDPQQGQLARQLQDTMNALEQVGQVRVCSRNACSWPYAHHHCLMCVRLCLRVDVWLYCTV